MKRNFKLRVLGRLALVFLWCASSSGCWAEEPVVDRVSVEAASSNDNVQVEEIKESFVVEKINYLPTRGAWDVFGINNFAIRFMPNTNAERGRSILMGKVNFPDSLKLGDLSEIRWSDLKGKKVSVYCKREEAFVADEKFCFSPRQLCGKHGDTNFTFDKYCSLLGKNEYFIKL